MYHALAIGLTTLVIYLFTLALSSSGFLNKEYHRRFWNWVLMTTFLMAGLLGLFMALKITYKWDIPFSGQLLHWHVEAGIAMAFAAMIHLSWHLRYYFRKNKTGSPESAGLFHPHQEPDGKTVSRLLILTGFASSAVQFILMREAVILGGGTEASAGLFLWLWLIIAAAGAVTGERSGNNDLRKMMWTLIAGMALAPLIFLFMNTILLEPGESPSVLKILAIISVSVAPVTYISSFIFVRLSSIRRRYGAIAPGDSFSTETAGSAAAGILTATTVTIYISNYQLYIIILLLSLSLVAAITGYPRRARRAILAGALMMTVTVLVFSPDPAVRSILLRGVKAEKSVDTPYGNITTGTYGGEATVFYDHRPLFFSGDVIRAEEDVHYALLQREKYDKVMMISGGLMKHIGQLQKHSIGEVVYLEHDPGIISAGGERDTTAGPMVVSVRKSDPISFMRKNNEVYDAILQLIPPPSTLSVSRYFTIGYFRTVKEHLSPGGLFLCTPMPYFNYVPESYCKGFSPVCNALNEVFSHVVLIPGSSLYVIASDSPLSDSISVLAVRRGIKNNYVNGDYLNDDDSRRKSGQLISQVDRSAGFNTADRPVSSWFANLFSLESKGIGGGVVAALALLVIIPFAFIRRGGLMMFASSAGLAGFAMITIFILQMTVGNMYLLSALVLTLLMAGLAAGAGLGRAGTARSMMICTTLLAVIYGVAGLLAPSLLKAVPGIVLPVIFTFLLSAGYLTGLVFRVLTIPGSQGTTGGVYASDLAGSALGYLTISTLLVPLAGISNVSFILAAFIFIAGIIGSVRYNH
jgi:spermidine synthase